VSGVVRHEASIIRRLSLDMTLDGEPRTTTEQIAESLSGVDWHDGYLFLGSDEGRGLERLESALDFLPFVKRLIRIEALCRRLSRRAAC
jgi:hypothetical protein